MTTTFPGSDLTRFPAAGLADAYYIDGVNGSDANDGLAQARPWKTWGAVRSRVLERLNGTNVNVTIFVLGDVDEPVLIEANWRSVSPTQQTEGASLLIDSDLGSTVVGSGTITSVVVANPGTPAAYQVNVTGFDWSTHVGDVLRKADGTACTVLVNLGGGSAIVSQPFVEASYDPTRVPLAGGDAFQVLRRPKLGTTLEVRGGGSTTFIRSHLGDLATHAIGFMGANVFLDTCWLSSFDAYSQSQIQCFGCFVAGSIRIYNNGNIYMAGGGTTGSMIVHGQGQMTLQDFTTTQKIRSGEGGGTYLVSDGWLCCYGANAIIDVGPDFLFRCLNDVGATDVRPFGIGVNGTTIGRIQIRAGAVGFEYDSASGKPNMAGSGVESTIAGASTLFSAWPTGLARVATPEV